MSHRFTPIRTTQKTVERYFVIKVDREGGERERESESGRMGERERERDRERERVIEGQREREF